MTTNKSIFSKIVESANGYPHVNLALEAFSKTIKLAVDDITKIAEAISKLAILVNQHNQAINDIIKIQEVIINHLKIHTENKMPSLKKEDLN